MDKFNLVLGTGYCFVGILTVINGSFVGATLGWAYCGVGILLILKGAGLIFRGIADRVRIE